MGDVSGVILLRPMYDVVFTADWAVAFRRKGRSFLYLYDKVYLRYGIIFICFVCLLWNQKKIRTAIKRILSVREKKY